MNNVKLQESQFDKSLNMVFTVVLVVGSIGAIGYFYLKKKYGEKLINTFT
jgi:hypothetical protein